MSASVLTKLYTIFEHGEFSTEQKDNFQKVLARMPDTEQLRLLALLEDPELAKEFLQNVDAKLSITDTVASALLQDELATLQNY